MKLALLLGIGLAAACGLAHAQTFPYEDDYSTYPPGSTGAPVWSVLRGGSFNASEGGLHGGVLARYNLRPPRKYTAEVAIASPVGASAEARSVAFRFNGQDEKALTSADEVALRFDGTGASMVVSAGSRQVSSTPVTLGKGAAVKMRLATDADSGRYAVWIDNALVVKGSCEYPAGLLAVSLSEGMAAQHFTIRMSTDDEKQALSVSGLFNDPRDIADGGDGLVLVLHRGSPAVCAVTLDGEIRRSFGRRIATGIPDPVAMAIGASSEVLVLNRYPGEVVAYDHNGGIRRRFGKGRMGEPVDLTALASGSIYVADAAARAIVMFSADGKYTGTHSLGEAIPEAIAVDAVGNLVVSVNSDRTMIFRPLNASPWLVLLRETKGGFDDEAAIGQATWVLRKGVVTSSQAETAGSSAFSAAAVGTLGPNGRMAAVGETMYVLDRDHCRVVAVPPDRKDAAPEVTLQNVVGSSALVRWDSQRAATTARVHLLRGSTWDTVEQVTPKPSSRMQVVLERLKPGQTYKYCVSPTLATIPPSRWSAEYSFSTPATEPKP